jgi:hypothetical protein
MSSLRTMVCCTAVLAALSACDASVNIGGPPTGGSKCPGRHAAIDDPVSQSLVLTAQSVPTAALLPCLYPLPAGWTFHEMQAQKGKTRIVLDFGRAADRALTVTLTRNCDVRGAARTNSDHAGARRYDRHETGTSGYRGERYYLFSGGCVAYRFALTGEAGAEPIATISRGVGLVDRSVVRRWVHHESDGKIELDPPGSEAG